MSRSATESTKRPVDEGSVIYMHIYVFPLSVALSINTDDEPMEIWKCQCFHLPITWNANVSISQSETLEKDPRISPQVS